jgi:hypothetical protein
MIIGAASSSIIIGVLQNTVVFCSCTMEVMMEVTYQCLHRTTVRVAYLLYGGEEGCIRACCCKRRKRIAVQSDENCEPHVLLSGSEHSCEVLL